MFHKHDLNLLFQVKRNCTPLLI